MALKDTRPEVRRLQPQLLRSLRPAGRLGLAREATESVHRAQLAGLRQRHPDLDESAPRGGLGPKLRRSPGRQRPIAWHAVPYTSWYASSRPMVR